jgi:hypothetical protein
VTRPAVRPGVVTRRLLLVAFFFNFFYMPIEVALPLCVRGTLHGATPPLFPSFPIEVVDNRAGQAGLP